MQGGELYVPRIPSMKVIDLAKTIAPDAEITEVGVRPGEKLHEEMVSVEDSRNTIRQDDRYIVMPTLAEWGFVQPPGEPVPDGFSYSSDSNDLWLTEQDLQSFLGNFS